MKRKSLEGIAMITIVMMVSAQGVIGIAASSKKPKISKSFATMPVGYSCKLYLKNKPKKGIIKWKSKNKKIATVNKRGKVTGKKVGKTKIFCIVKMGRKKVRLVCHVSVLKPELKHALPTAAANVTNAPTASANATNSLPENGGSNNEDVAPTPSTASAMAKVNIGNVDIVVGRSLSDVKNTLGDASYTLASEYEGCVWHIYNSNYKQLTMILVKNNEVVGVYTDGKQFNYDNINTETTESMLTTKCFSSNRYRETYTKRVGDITIKVYMDMQGDKTAEGILVMRKTTFALKADTCSTFEKISFELTNAFRVKNGLSAFAWNKQVADVARVHSEDMRDNNYFNHTSPSGAGPGDRLAKAGLSYMAYAENIAMGYEDGFEVTYGWINSSGHRSNILYAAVKELGVGVESNCRYYTQVFYKEK